MRVSTLGRLPSGARTIVVTAVVCVGLVSGCGGDDGSEADVADDPAASSSTTAGSPSADPTSEEPTTGPTGAEADWPACDDVWTDGATLPKSYDGCLDGDEAVKADASRCSSGQRLVTYDDRFWATAGGDITASAGSVRKDPEFGDVQSVCLG